MNNNALSLSAVFLTAVMCAHAIQENPSTYGSASDISAFNAAAGEYEGWENLVNSNTDITGYGGGYPGFNPWPASVSSNTANSAGNAVYSKTSGAGYAGTGSIYSSATGAFSLSSTVNSLSDVNTVIFQLDAGIQGGPSAYLPTLSYNGGSQALQADYSGNTNGSFTNSFGGNTIYSTNLFYQWDLSEAGEAISSFAINYSVTPHTQTYALQLNSSEAELSGSVIPEPGTYALIAGMAALGACAVRRRQK